jgi:hypothetical protein
MMTRQVFHSLDNIKDGLVHSLGRGKGFHGSFIFGFCLNLRLEFLQSLGMFFKLEAMLLFKVFEVFGIYFFDKFIGLSQ